MARPGQSIYHWATCIGVHIHFCKTGPVGHGALRKDIQPGRCVTVGFRVGAWSVGHEPADYADNDFSQGRCSRMKIVVLPCTT